MVIGGRKGAKHEAGAAGGCRGDRKPGRDVACARWWIARRIVVEGMPWRGSFAPGGRDDGRCVRRGWVASCGAAWGEAGKDHIPYPTVRVSGCVCAFTPIRDCRPRPYAIAYDISVGREGNRRRPCQVHNHRLPGTPSWTKRYRACAHATVSCLPHLPYAATRGD